MKLLIKFLTDIMTSAGEEFGKHLGKNASNALQKPPKKALKGMVAVISVLLVFGVCYLGYWGVQPKWTLSNGTLTISKGLFSNGEMPDYQFDKPYEVEDENFGYEILFSSVPWFGRREEITSVIIRNGVTHIGAAAFAECKNLKTVRIPQSVISIGDYAFSDCLSLKAVSLPDSVRNIGAYAFNQCESLANVSIPMEYDREHVDVWYTYDNPGEIKEYAFRQCINLSHADIPGGVAVIGYCAFDECAALTDVSISPNATEIGSYAFFRSGLTDVKIPSGVVYIGWHAFRNCQNLRSVEIPNSVETIDMGAFQDCASLESVEIPDSVKYVAQSAFEGCSSLRSVKLSQSLTHISPRTFLGCSSLTSVEIPDGVQDISNLAFQDCSSLVHVEIPDSFKSIGIEVFRGCTELSSVSIPWDMQFFPWDEQLMADSSETQRRHSDFFNSGDLDSFDDTTTVIRRPAPDVDAVLPSP